MTQCPASAPPVPRQTEIIDQGSDLQCPASAPPAPPDSRSLTCVRAHAPDKSPGYGPTWRGTRGIPAQLRGNRRGTPLGMAGHAPRHDRVGSDADPQCHLANDRDEAPEPRCACCEDELTFSTSASSLCARCRVDGLDFPTWAHCQREAGSPERLITRRRYLADTADPTERTA